MISVAEACGAAALGVVLTGMETTAHRRPGHQEAAGQCLAESELSAVIFGMPQEAIRAGAVDKSCPGENGRRDLGPLHRKGAARPPCPDRVNTLDKLIHLVYNYVRFTMADTARGKLSALTLMTLRKAMEKPVFIRQFCVPSVKKIKG